MVLTPHSRGHTRRVGVHRGKHTPAEWAELYNQQTAMRILTKHAKLACS